MKKTILITGATDGIGLETAKVLVEQGHTVWLHGRNVEKLAALEQELSKYGTVESYVGDLSNRKAVKAMLMTIKQKHTTLDVLINNAGVLKTNKPRTDDGFDVRFMVNTIVPYLLTTELLPLLGPYGRVVNVSSAAQHSVNLKSLAGDKPYLEDMEAYSQSKLAIIMWSHTLVHRLGETGPMIVCVNPGSLLGTKMVKEGFGVAGKDIKIGADVLVRAALSKEFYNSSGRYFDNDIGQFANPNQEALNLQKCDTVTKTIEGILAST